MRAGDLRELTIDRGDPHLERPDFVNNECDGVSEQLRGDCCTSKTPVTRASTFRAPLMNRIHLGSISLRIYPEKYSINRLLECRRHEGRKVAC
jgi:hypothetical protein